MSNHHPPLKGLVGIPFILAYFSIGRTFLYEELISTGKLRPLKLGRKTVFDFAEVEALRVEIIAQGGLPDH